VKVESPQTKVHTPPSADRLPPTVAKVLAEWRRLAADFGAAQARLGQLSDSRAAVEDEDAAAAGLAIRQGKANPGQKKFEAHLKAVGEARHAAKSLAHATDDAARDLLDAIEAHRAAILAEAEREAQEACRAFRDLVAATATAHDAVVAAYSQVRWIERFPERSKGGGTLPLALAGQNGDPLDAATVLAALRGAVPDDREVEAAA